MTSGPWWFQPGLTRFVISSCMTLLLQQYAYMLRMYTSSMHASYVCVQAVVRYA